MYHANPNIEKLYRTGAHEGRGDYLRLDMNENPGGLPREFFDKALARITPELLAMYPEPGKLIDRLSRTLGVEPSQVAVTNGSDDAIKTVFEVFGGPDKALVSVYPSFEMYSVYAKMFGMEHRIISYDTSFHVSVERILTAIDTDVKMVALLNPNNPIGTVYSQEEAEQIIKKALKMGAIVILDEAYYYFYSTTFLELSKKYDNVILTRTFSKLCSLAGVRIGYAVASPEIVRLINNARPTYSVNAVAIEFACAILDEPDLISELIRKEHEGRQYLIQQLKESGYTFISENGNYVFIKPNGKASSVCEKLKRGGILVKTYDNDLLRDYVRITTGGIVQMKLFFDCFKKIDLKTIKK